MLQPAEAARSASPPRARVLGCEIDRVDMSEAVARDEAAIDERRFCQHMSVNAAKLVAMQDDAELAAGINRAELVTADGQAVVWAARLLGDPLPTRVAGIDLMLRTIALAERRGYGIFILGARDHVLEKAVERLRARYLNLRIVGYQHGYSPESEDEDVAARIRASGADILYVAMSSPRKEYFLARHGADVGTPFVMGVGGSIDVVAGVVRRAPVWVQRAGIEWLYRMAQEPRRLFRRYLVTNVRFVLLVMRDALRRRRGARS